jgi:hypothetical protein
METSTANSHCLPKFHTSDVSLRPIRKATGSPFHQTSRYLILYMQNSRHLVETLNQLTESDAVSFSAFTWSYCSPISRYTVYCAGDGPGASESSSLSHDLSVLTETNVVHKLKLCPKLKVPQWGPTFPSAGELVLDTSEEEVTSFSRDARINIFSTHSYNNLATRRTRP